MLRNHCQLFLPFYLVNAHAVTSSSGQLYDTRPTPCASYPRDPRVQTAGPHHGREQRHRHPCASRHAVRGAGLPPSGHPLPDRPRGPQASPRPGGPGEGEARAPTARPHPQPAPSQGRPAARGGFAGGGGASSAAACKVMEGPNAMQAWLAWMEEHTHLNPGRPECIWGSTWRFLGVLG